jgi:hypothetical protein
MTSAVSGRAALALTAAGGVLIALAVRAAGAWLDEWHLARATQVEAARQRRARWWRTWVFRAKLVGAGATLLAVAYASYRLRSRTLPVPAVAVAPTGGGKASVVTVAY